MAKSGQFARAYKKLAENYKLLDPATPMAIVAHAAKWALEAKSYVTADKLASQVTEQRLPWWKNYAKSADTAAEDISAFIEKTTDYERQVMWVAGEAKSHRFASQYSQLTPQEKIKLKAELKALYDALIQSDFDSEKVEAFNTRVIEAEELAVKSEVKGFRAVFLRQVFWRDSFDFSDGGISYKGIALAQGLCAGGKLGRANHFSEYSLNGCLGQGKASLDFDGPEFSKGHSTLFALVGASAIRKYSDNNIGVGLDLSAIARQIDITSAQGGSNKEWRVGISPAAILRLATSESFFFEVKGGRIIGERSGIWSLDFGWTL